MRPMNYSKRSSENSRMPDFLRADKLKDLKIELSATTLNDYLSRAKSGGKKSVQRYWQKPATMKCSTPLAQKNRLSPTFGISKERTSPSKKLINQVKLSEIRSLNISASLYVVQKCTQACKTAYKLFGWISFSLDDVIVTKQGIIQPHPNMKSLNLKRITQESQIVKNLVEQTKLISSISFQDFHNYYIRSNQRKIVDLKSLLTLIKSYRLCSKIQIATKISQQFLNTQKPSTHNKSITDRYSFKSRYSGKFQPSIDKKKCEKVRRKTFNLTNEIKVVFNPCVTMGHNQKICFDEQSETKMKNKQIQQQFSLSIGSKSPLNKKSSITVLTKQSQMSTSNGTSHLETRVASQGSQWGSFTFSNNFSLITAKKSDHQTSSFNHFNFSSILSDNLEEVQSEGSICEREVQDFSTARNNTIEDQEILKQMKQNEEQIWNKNQWTKKIDNLLFATQNIKQSYMENKLQDIPHEPRQAKVGGIWDTTMVSSFVKPQNPH